MSATTIPIPESLIGIQPVTATVPIPIANGSTTIHGTLIALNGSGFIVPMTATTGLIAAGLEDGPGGTGNAAGTVFSTVRQFSGYFFNSSIAPVTEANVGQVVFAEDNQTVSASTQTNTLSPLGVLVSYNPLAPTGQVCGVEVSIANSTLIAAIVGISGVPVNVANGGTGANTFTVHGVLVGETANPVQATAAGTNGQFLAGQTSANPSFVTISGDITIDQTGAGAIGAKKVTPAQDAVAAVGGFGNQFTATVVLADSAGGATTNVVIPQKLELVSLFVVKGGVTSASASDTVQIKNHTGAVQITTAIPLNVAANTFVPLTGVTFQNKVLLATDSFDLIQAAHTTDNSCIVTLNCIARA